MKTTLQVRQQRDLHAELRWRCRAALRAGVLLERQCRELEARLLPGSSRREANELMKVLDLLGAPQQPRLPLEARGRKRPRSLLALPSQVLAAGGRWQPQEQHHYSAGTSAVAFSTTRHCSRPWSRHLHRCRATMSAALAHARCSTARRRILVQLRKVATSAFERFRPRGWRRINHGSKASAAPGHCFTQQLWRPSKMMPHTKLACSRPVLQPLGQLSDQPSAKKGRFS